MYRLIQHTNNNLDYLLKFKIQFLSTAVRLGLQVMLLSDIVVILYKAGLRMGVEDTHKKFSYFIGDFNLETNVVVLQQKQDYKAPKIKDLKSVITEHYTFMATNSFFIALDILNSCLRKFTLNKPTLNPGSCKILFNILPPPKSLSLHCKQINRVKNKVNGQP